MGVDVSVGLRTRALRFFIKKTFTMWESMGVHLTLNHFYWPVPDTRDLDERFFARRTGMPGVDMNAAGQLAMLDRIEGLRPQYTAIPLEATADPNRFHLLNGTFESVDAEVLYAMVRLHRPRKVVEIGSGNSTFLTAQALVENAAAGAPPAELVAVEPYPWPRLKAGFPGLTRIVEKKIQDVPLEEFTSLGGGDILFIDSSHVLKNGSDVQFEFLEVLPRLAKGVLVHLHDIFLPAEYPESWVKRDRRFWNEQYLLQAFLAFNSGFEVVWAGSWMHLTHPDRLAKAFPSYDAKSVWPGSFWIRRC